MQSNSGGAQLSSSPPLPETLRADKRSSRMSTRRGSTASWLLPHASIEAPVADDGKAAVTSQSSVQADDYRIFNSDSSSVFSGVETVAPQSQRSSLDPSTRRGPYGLLTGLLTRRSNAPKSKKSDVSARPTKGGDPLQATSSQTTATPSSGAARNPLLAGYDPPSPHISTGRTQVDAGGYDWPYPPSPNKVSESLHPPRSSSRHELTASPMLSLASHSSPYGTALRGDRKEKRSGSRFTDHGESHFVPLGSVDVASRAGSASVRRHEAEETNTDSALSTSNAPGRAALPGKRRNGGHGVGGGIATGSLSASESHSHDHLTHTRGSQVRAFSTEDNELSAPSSSSNVRNMRDAKAALLRHAQGANNGSVRTSRVQSSRRLPSNVNGLDSASLQTHRAEKTRGASRERRSLNGSRRDDNGGSLYSIGIEDDAVRTSMSPGSVGSPMLSRPGVLFPAIAVNQEGNAMSPSHVGASRRFSRTEEGSGAILEVMERSALTSRATVNGNSNVIGTSHLLGNSAGQTTRGRSAGSKAARLSTERQGGGTSREDAPHIPSSASKCSSVAALKQQRHVLGGGYSLRASQSYFSDIHGSEGSEEMEERHRHKVDEVIRQLNRPQRSIAGGNQSTMSRAAASETHGTRDEVVAVLNTNRTSGAANNENGNSRGTNVDYNNSTSVGGCVTWSGIGGLGWESPAGFGSIAADSTTAETGVAANNGGGGGGNAVSGGWAGLGGDGGGSDDWYARMRKKAEDEERA